MTVIDEEERKTWILDLQVGFVIVKYMHDGRSNKCFFLDFFLSPLICNV